MTQQVMFSAKRSIVILIALQIILGSAYLSSVPRIHVDEVWDSSIGYNLAHQGTLKQPFIEGFGGMGIQFVQNRVVVPFVCAAIFKICDYSIAASRAGSLSFGVLAVISLYFIMRHWFGEKQAFWIALATILHPWFFEVSRRARPEIYYTALALVFLWLLTFFLDSSSRRSAFFTGIFAGLSALAHPNGLIITFSIGCAVVVWLKPKLIGRLLQWASIGFLLTVLPYITYVLWAIQNPQISFTEQMQLGMLHKSFLSGEIIRWKSFFQWPIGAPLATITLVSWILAWYRSSATDKALATVVAMFSFILPFATVNINARYLVAITPFLCALIIRLIWRITTGDILIRKNWYKYCPIISATIAIIYLSTCTTAIGLMLYHLRGADFTKVINRVASVVGPNSRVFGDPIFWVGHNQYQYGPYLIHYGDLRLSDALKTVRKHHFDYAIRTSWLIAPSKGFDRPPDKMPAFRDDHLGDWLCRIFGTKVDEFRDPYYGPIEIYKLNWDKSSLKR